MKSYNQFMCEVYDLQESGQIDLAENPFKGMVQNYNKGVKAFGQSPVGKAIGSTYKAITTNPIVNNPVTRFVARQGGRTPVTAAIQGGLDAVDRKDKGQTNTRSYVGGAVRGLGTSAGIKYGALAGGKLCAATMNPAIIGACSVAGGIAGGITGYQASGAAIDKTPVGSQLDKVDSALRKKPKPKMSAAGAVGTTGDALGSRLPTIRK